MFVSVLVDLIASTNHCIDISCKSRLIYDDVDLKAKRLTKENIEYNAGVYENDVSGGFTGLVDVAEIVKIQGK